jgi:hypothetical protein
MSSEWVIDLDWSKYDNEMLKTIAGIYHVQVETRRDNYEERSQCFDIHTDGFLLGMKANIEREISRRLK